jgi:RNA polymerase sigma-70 factor (ECF subfamily)
LKAWLFRILYNRWVSTHRAKQCRPVEVFADRITEGDLARSAESEFLDAMPNGEIAAAIATLPEGFRAVVYYADVQGFTYAETAELLGIPMGTVMSRIARARKRLRFALAHLAQADGNCTSAQPDIA